MNEIKIRQIKEDIFVIYSGFQFVASRETLESACEYVNRVFGRDADSVEIFKNLIF